MDVRADIGGCAPDARRSADGRSDGVVGSARPTWNDACDASGCGCNVRVHGGQRDPVRKASVVRLVRIAVVVTVMVVGCQSDPVRSTAQRLYEATTPAGGSATAFLFSREPSLATASWEVRPNMDWESYLQWVATQLMEQRFERSGAAIAEVTFTRTLEGDTQKLGIRPVGNATSLRVAVTFQSLPL